MFESLGFETLTPKEASVWFGLILGLAFGALAEVTRFCLRRGLVGTSAERRPALGVWLTALAVAILGTQAAVQLGLVDFAEHRFMASDLPVLSIALGGLLFGAGMVLARGCASRLTVLTASGNLRALTVLIIFAIVAHATMKGVLAPARVWVSSVTVPLGEASLAALPGGGLLWAAVLAAGALAVVSRSGARPSHLILSVLIGALVVAGWVGTGFVLYDEFDPIALESLSFASPSLETLFWVVASSAIPAGFGTGLVGGVLAGAFVSALLARRFEWQSFTSPEQTGRYVAGGALMGFGAVLAGGCTVGAGLSGVPTLSVAALLTLGFIALGAIATSRVLNVRAAFGSVAPSSTPQVQPAE